MDFQLTLKHPRRPMPFYNSFYKQFVPISLQLWTAGLCLTPLSHSELFGLQTLSRRQWLKISVPCRLLFPTRDVSHDVSHQIHLHQLASHQSIHWTLLLSVTTENVNVVEQPNLVLVKMHITLHLKCESMTYSQRMSLDWLTALQWNNWLTLLSDATNTLPSWPIFVTFFFLVANS